MKIALVHDWLTGWRGGEKVLAAIAEIFPEADIWTLVYESRNIPPFLQQRIIKTSWLQKMPAAKTKYRYYLPLLPLFAELLNLDNYDLIISSNHCVAKNVRSSAATLHISYTHTPMRYIWDLFDHYFGSQSSYSWPVRTAARILRPFLRFWDAHTSQRVDHFVVNSNFVGQRVRRYYGRDYQVIYPPVEVEKFRPPARVKKEDYYILISALVPYKRIDLALEAFAVNGRRLLIVGQGPEEERLRALAPPNVVFTGYLPQEEMISLLQRARALIYPQIEDFGITAVEAQAAGTPVLAYRDGGALETVREKESGLFFFPQTATALNQSLVEMEKRDWSPLSCIENAQRFSRGRFKREFAAFVQEKLIQFQSLLR